MIFLDANVPMYLVGTPHPNKEAARRALEETVAGSESLCTDAEVLQEILHRYTVVAQRTDMDAAFDALLAMVDVVYPIERADVERARRLLGTTPRLSARDAIHVAVMQGRDVGRILTFDRGFDGIPGIVRLA